MLYTDMRGDVKDPDVAMARQEQKVIFTPESEPREGKLQYEDIDGDGKLYFTRAITLHGSAEVCGKTRSVRLTCWVESPGKDAREEKIAVRVARKRASSAYGSALSRLEAAERDYNRRLDTLQVLKDAESRLAAKAEEENAA